MTNRKNLLIGVCLGFVAINAFGGCTSLSLTPKGTNYLPQWIPAGTIGNQTNWLLGLWIVHNDGKLQFCRVGGLVSGSNFLDISCGKRRFPGEGD